MSQSTWLSQLGSEDREGQTSPLHLDRLARPRSRRPGAEKRRQHQPRHDGFGHGNREIGL